MPFDPVLTLETAALMLAVFLLGATIGSLLHLLLLRLRRAPAVTATTAALPVSTAATALVAAPVIAPLAVPRDPVMPTEILVPDFAAAMAAPPPPLELAPARKPGVATFGRDVGRHDREAPPVPSQATTVVKTEEAAPRIEPDVLLMAESLPLLAAPDEEATAPLDDPATTPTVEDNSGASAVPAILPAVDVTDEPLAIAPSAEVAPIKAVPATPALSAAEAEAAAMRAIEGNWTPGRRMPSAEPPVEPVAEASPEVAAIAAEPSEPETVSEVVETQATPDIVVTDDDKLETTTADSTPLAEVPDVIPPHEEDRIVPAEISDEPEPEPAPLAAPPAAQEQPPGLGAPRHGMRDDLTQIVGVLPVVETTLNRLGVYHFDQVADWSDGHAGWVEAHLGIAGRVEREHWREQARELAAIASGKRPGRKKHPS